MPDDLTTAYAEERQGTTDVDVWAERNGRTVYVGSFPPDFATELVARVNGTHGFSR